MSNLSVKEKIKKHNSNISEMIEKLTKFHKENSKITNNYDNPNYGHLGDVYAIAENLEQVLLLTGVIKEEESQYQN